MPRKLQSLQLLALATVTLLCFCTPITGPHRSLAPNNMASELGLTEPAPVHPLHKDAPLEAVILIAPDAALTMTPIKASDLPQRERAELTAMEAAMAARHPYRFQKSMALSIGTYARANNCSITLTLHTGLESKPLNCLDLIDNDLAVFSFDRFIGPGRYIATLKSDGTAENAVAPYIMTAPDDTRHLHAHSILRGVSAVDGLKFWFISADQSFWIYTLVLISALPGLVFLKPQSTLLWVVFFASSIIGGLLITPPFSGHDETAHVVMAHMAATGAKEYDPDFNRRANGLLLASDFYRFHKVAMTADLSSCPHDVAFDNQCGATPRPVNYYKLISHATGWIFDLKSPEGLVLWGRVINATQCILTFALIWALCSRTIFLASLGIATICSTIVAQSIAITNDFPNLMLGVFLAANFGEILISGFSHRLWLAGVLATLWLVAAISIDISGYAGIAPVVLLWMSILAVFVQSYFFKSDSSCNTKKNFAIRTIFDLFSYFATFGGLMLLFWNFDLVLTKAQSWNLVDIRAWLVDVPYSSNLSLITSLDLNDALRLLWLHLKSLFGRFVWGNFDLGLNTNLVQLSLLLIVSYPVFFKYKLCRCTPHNLVMHALMAGLAFHLAKVLALGAPFWLRASEPVEPFIAFRLLNPGYGVLMALPVAGLASALGSTRHGEAIKTVFLFWTTTLLCFVLPKIYWVYRL